MSPRARAVVLPVALATWLAPFLAGCSSGDATESGGDKVVVTSAAPEKIALRYVTWKVEPATDFQRISEYFDGEENTGGDTIVRSQKNDRRGLYFILALEWSAKLPDGAVAMVDFVSSEGGEPKHHAFLIPPVDKPAHLREIRLGFTGKDWPEIRKARPVAWKITLRDAKSLDVIATAQSYLWSFDRPAR